MDTLHGKRVLVLGLGMSGRSAAKFCHEHGAIVTACDERPAEKLPDIDTISSYATLRLGQPFPDPAQYDLIVPSPGIPATRYAGCGKPVWGDIELFYRACRIPIVAITGTNGKSTVTTLTHAMLQAAGLRSEAAGNIGKPALEWLGTGLDAIVLEVSSFQLDTTDRFAPHVAVLLNITPDHLDRHGSFAEYIASKARILKNLSASDFAVLNFDDEHVRALAQQTRAHVLGFSLKEPVSDGAWWDANRIVLQTQTGTQSFSLDGVRLSGLHNIENILASLLAAVALGAAPQRAWQALANFHGLPHRTQFVAEIRGVTFVNDSKGTNVGAAARALAGYTRPVVWIAGGKDKDLDFGALAPIVKAHVRHTVLIGEAAPKIEKALAGTSPMHHAKDIDTAVRQAFALAEAGDIVLLSPACASFDQFKNFEDRGARFTAAVQSLLREGNAK